MGQDYKIASSCTVLFIRWNWEATLEKLRSTCQRPPEKSGYYTLRYKTRKGFEQKWFQSCNHMRSVKTRRGQEGNDNCGMSSPWCFSSVWETWDFRLSALTIMSKAKSRYGHPIWGGNKDAGLGNFRFRSLGNHRWGRWWWMSFFL